MYYNDPIDNPLSLNIHQYAKNLANATTEAFKIVLNDTKLSFICALNQTDPNGVPCDVSNWNPFAQKNNTNNHRMMLNQDYSYQYHDNNNNGWWQARIENLHFCVVLDLEWDPNSCDLYDKDKPAEEEAIVTSQATYVAFGTFDVVADSNVNNFDQYFENKINSNNTIFASVLNSKMNQLFHGNKKSDLTFELIAFTIESEGIPYEKPSIDKFGQAALDLTFGLYGFIIFCLVMAIWAELYAWYKGADNVKSINIVFFGIWVWDLFSDLIFSARAIDQRYFLQGALGIVFVFIPWFVNVYVLIQSQKKWTQDNSIKFRISRWLLKYNKKLIFLTLICGSAFAAVDLCNSRAFGVLCKFTSNYTFKLPKKSDIFLCFCCLFVCLVSIGYGMFNMGLTERHLRKFRATRIYSTVLFENLPQLMLQISYFISRDGTDVVAVLAFLSSVVSIFISLTDAYSSMSLLQAIKHAKRNGYFQTETYFLSLVGSTVVTNDKLFRRRPNAMRKIFAEVLECDMHCIECNLIVRIENGLEYGFTVFSLSANDEKNNGRLKRMIRMFESALCNDHSAESVLVSRIKEEFTISLSSGSSNASVDSDISISNVATFYDDKTKYGPNFDQDYKAITESNYYQLHQNMFSFDKVGIYQSIAVNIPQVTQNATTTNVCGGDTNTTAADGDGGTCPTIIFDDAEAISINEDDATVEYE